MPDAMEPATANEPIGPVEGAQPSLADPESAEPAPSVGPAVASSGVGASRGRWLIALGVAAGAIAIAIVAAILLGGRPTPEALTYIPGNSAVVAELRLDLPGDQLQKVGNLLAHFPGFQDQSTLTQKIDETLTHLVGSATNGKVDYATQVQPWVAGPLFAGGTPTSGAAAGSAVPGMGSFVVVATTDGSVKGDALFKAATPTP